MKIIDPINQQQYSIKAVIFDFDGTLSTLRYGWDSIMRSYFKEVVINATEDHSISPSIEKEINDHVETAGGFQTVISMQWFVNLLNSHDIKHLSQDPWEYKNEFYRRLVESAYKKVDQIRSGEKDVSDYRIIGSVEILKKLKEKGLPIYIASGTDEPDLLNEIEILEFGTYITKAKGSPLGHIESAKESCLNQVLANGFQPNEVLIIGDGRVEIQLGRSRGTLTLGLATDEEILSGPNEVKERVLTAAGAHAIVYNYLDYQAIMDWAGIS